MNNGNESEEVVDIFDNLLAIIRKHGFAFMDFP